MKGDKRKERKKMIKNAKKVDKTAKHVVPTLEEVNADRLQYLSTEKVKCIQSAHEMVQMFFNIHRLDVMIKFRQEELKEGGKILEKFEGMIKPKELLELEYQENMYSRKRQLLEYTRLRDKMIKKYKFTEDEVVKIINGDFDWNKYEIRED